GVGLLDLLAKGMRVQELAISDVARPVLGLADLRKYIVPSTTARPVIDGPDHPVKRHLCADSDEDHKTLPSYLGPPGLARCGHCVSHRSAYLPILRPESDSLPAFATLS